MGLCGRRVWSYNIFGRGRGLVEFWGRERVWVVLVLVMLLRHAVGDSVILVVLGFGGGVRFAKC